MRIKEQQSGRWDPVSPKKVQALLLATFYSMKAVDLPRVIEGHEPICTPTGAACEGRVRSMLWGPVEECNVPSL